MQYCYQTASYPCIFFLKRELGESFLSYGAAKSALEWFLPLQMWEQVITCYMVMEREDKAKQVIEEQLLLRPKDALLHCIMGDITQQAQHYETAWQLGKLARAQRALGQMYWKQGQYDACIQALELALQLNTLYAMSWFLLGCACIKQEYWTKALQGIYLVVYFILLLAFTRVVQLEPEDVESWTNLSSIYIQLKDYKKAMITLQEALKHKHDNWKLWENLMHASMHIREYQQVVHSMSKVLEYKPEKLVNIGILQQLVAVCIYIYTCNMQC